MMSYNALTILSIMFLSISSLHLGTASDPALPQEIKASCDKWGEAYDICPELLEAICFQESRYTPDVVGGTCKGLMQINEPVHKKRIKDMGIKDIYDIDSNIHLGADILAVRKLQRRCWHSIDVIPWRKKRHKKRQPR